MTLAVILTMIAAFLWAITSYIEKFLVCDNTKKGNNIKTLLVFSTLIAGSIISPFWLIANKFSVNISTISLISVFISSIAYIIATYFYFKALEKNDASIVVAMFQLIPVFSYLLALVFFKENLTIKQTLGSLVIIISAILIAFDLEEKNNKSKWNALVFMILSSLFYAVYYFLFDTGIRDSSYNSCAFWFQIGLLIQGLAFININSFRTSFVSKIKENGKRYFTLNITNESINLIANLLVNLANVMIPLALVNVLNGFHGVFVFILGVIGVKLLPKYFKENLNKKVVIQKVGCIILSIVGLIIMFL